MVNLNYQGNRTNAYTIIMLSPIHTDNALPTEWHVLGSGAMGCLWAAALQQAGHHVNLVLRNTSQLARYPGHIVVESPAATEAHTQTLEMTAWAPEQGPPAQRPVQWLLIATKAQDVHKALYGISQWLAPDAYLILLQNGLQVQQQLSIEYGRRVLCLSSSHGA